MVFDESTAYQCFASNKSIILLSVILFHEKRKFLFIFVVACPILRPLRPLARIVSPQYLTLELGTSILIFF